jgi:hypothetical protein
MVSASISTDARVRELSCAGARLLFTWMIPHADNMGRMIGNPLQIRATVIPFEPDVTDQMVEAWLGEMTQLGLIDWYEFDGNRFLRLAGWNNHQDLSKYRPSSNLPGPDGYAAECGGLRRSPASKLSEVKSREVKLSEAKPSQEEEEARRRNQTGLVSHSLGKAVHLGGTADETYFDRRVRA